MLTWHIRRNDSSKLCHFLKKRVGRVELDLIYSVGFKWGRNFIQKWTSVWSIDHFFVMTFLNVMTFSLKLVLPFNFNFSTLITLVKLIVMSFFCHFWNDILELTLPYETNSVGFRFLNSKWLFKKYLTAHFGPASTSSSILDDSSELLYLWTFYSKQVFAVKIRGQISRIIFLDSYFWIRIIWNFRE